MLSEILQFLEQSKEFDNSYHRYNTESARFDKRLDYFYVTGKCDGSQAVQCLFINICYGMENKTTMTHFLF